MFYNKNDLEYSIFLGSQELLKGTIHILSFCKYTIFFQKTKRQSKKKFQSKLVLFNRVSIKEERQREFSDTET